jgi:death-on-curing protein
MDHDDIEWVLEEVVHGFHAAQLAEHGGGEGIRDDGMLQSALFRPQQIVQYQGNEVDLCQLAAAYAFGLAKNHPFIDGNKRTAAITCELFLNLNGRFFTIGEIEKYPHYLALASGEHSEESFAAWLRTVTEEA